MGSIAVRHYVRVTGGQRDMPSVGELGHELAVEHQKDMAALAPVIGDVSG